MFLKIKNTKLIILICFISISISNQSNEANEDLFYNYYILNGSPNSIEFDHLLKNDYESNLIHILETDGIPSEASENYEEFLEIYYSQYRKENIRFVNAIVEPDIYILKT